MLFLSYQVNNIGESNLEGETKLIKTKMKLIAMALLLIISISGCAMGSKHADSENKSEKSDSLLLVGSTSMDKLSSAISERFMENNKRVKVSTEYTGSSAGIQSLLKGTADIGNVSRNLKSSETSSGAVENIVAIDAIVVVLGKDNLVDNLSKEELVRIYTGDINNWSEVGGENLPIVVVGRENGSGTRQAFEEKIDAIDKCKYANEINSTGAVIGKINSIPGGIGYISLDVVNESVKVISIDGISPSGENIRKGDYPLSRPFIMTTLGEIEEQREVVKDYFEFLFSDEGRKIIESIGLIGVN